MKKRFVSFNLCLLLALTLWVPARAGSGTDYKPILEETLENIYFTVTDPICGSIGGEWAALALARGGYQDDGWFGRYLDAVRSEVDACKGVLHKKKLTEYSRVILGLSAVGQDATKFDTGNQVYDLVSPLLTKQDNGEYLASWQGNNGTVFAIIALDTRNYFDNAAGRTARAGLLDALLTAQRTDGGWSISTGTSDIDTTAMALQAIGPYYLSQTKFDALGPSHSYSQLKSCVSKALNYLNTVKENDYGSVEAAAQVVVALAALDRDAANDKLLGDALGSVLAYYDGDGGFLHIKDGSDGDNQMSTEQAAYALVAYDRWKNGKTSLYDMTDLGVASEISVTAPSSVTVEQTDADTIKVTSSVACVVVAQNADGSYTRLTPEGSGDTRTFHTEQSEVVVRPVGDYNGDGKVKTTDLAQANLALLNGSVSELDALVMGAGNGKELRTVDLARLNLKLVNNDEIEW